MDGFVPERYVDEVTPEPRATPGDWIMQGDAPRLFPAGLADGDEPAALEPGEVVTFARLETHGIMIAEMRADGTAEIRGPLLKGECYCATGDPDTLCGSWEEFVACWFENGGLGVSETVHVIVFTWHYGLSYRLASADGRPIFEPAEDGDAPPLGETA